VDQHAAAVSIRFDPQQVRLIDTARRATLATLAPDGRPRLVPCCVALVEHAEGQTLVTPIDAKPKRSLDARQLARVRDVERDPRVALLIDHWDEDWGQLWWLRIEGLARLVWPEVSSDEHALAVAALRDRYPQYLAQPLENKLIIAIVPTSVTGWKARPDSPSELSPRP
jgi:PPOX class probable F420-dependent enzyme